MEDLQLLFLIVVLVTYAGSATLLGTLTTQEQILFFSFSGCLLLGALIILWETYSKNARERKSKLKAIKELPLEITTFSENSVYMGVDIDLGMKAYLSDSTRSRHVHILGATGTGKTESVILNFLNQDVKRGLGSIILDAKGDLSFLRELQKWVPSQKLKVFDLSDSNSASYDPLYAGSALESAQRLFSSLTWGEEYYKSRAFTTLQKLFDLHSKSKKTNPSLSDLNTYLETPESLSMILGSSGGNAKSIQQDYQDVSGLRDQVRSLCTGHLNKTLSPESSKGILLEDAKTGDVVYFRLQSLLSPQTVATVGKLIINHLNYIAGNAHRSVSDVPSKIPVYLDEFASFACPEFADLTSKARSAGMMLHFSHQSVGDVKEVSEGFLSRITDNSATKIILRISDPDTAEFFARTFGTRLIQKVTHRITNAIEKDSAELLGEGSLREAHQFRSSPDTFKSLSTGVGSVLIAHGKDTPHGASSVLKIKFPQLTKENS